MPPGDADRIRQYLCQQVEAVRDEGQPTLMFRVGDVRDVLSLLDQNAGINIANVLITQKFRQQAGVEFVKKTGSGESLDSTWQFEILNLPAERIPGHVEGNLGLVGRDARVTLSDLIGAGLLTSGQELVFRPTRLKRFVGMLSLDGSIQYEGQAFSSLSAWAVHVAGGPYQPWSKTSVNGISLHNLRQRLSSALSDRDTPKAEGPDVEPRSTNNQTVPMSNSDINDRLRDRLLKLSPSEFESLLGEYFSAKGFLNVEVTGRSNDGGIDGSCQIPFLNLKIAFQAKRYSLGNNIGIDPVQRLSGSLGNQYHRGVFVTTSSFTQPAIGWVQEMKAPITLVDGDALVSDMIELGLGVRNVPVVETRLDEEFFRQFDD